MKLTADNDSRPDRERQYDQGLHSSPHDSSDAVCGETPALSKPFVSIVIPCYNEEEVIEILRDRLTTLADGLQEKYSLEVILVDDGSTDSTWPAIANFAKLDHRFRGVKLSRNFGHQAALTCGYKLSKGNAVVCLDADLQDPPEVIPDMLMHWLEGADVVYGVRSSREGETKFKLWTAALFYRLIRWMGARSLYPDSGDFRLLSRRSLDALLSLPESHRFIRGMVGWLGFPSAKVVYDRRARAAGSTKYPLRKMVRFATDAIVSFSRFPLTVAYYVAIALSTVFVGYLGYSLVMYVWFDAPLVPGWASLILAVVTFGATNLICQAIMGEYVGRIYEQSKQRPLYLVEEVTEVPVPARKINRP